MGLFSWVSDTSRKSVAAAAIQGYFEISKRYGVFPGDPMHTANKILDIACARVPGLPSGQYRGYVLAAAALAIVVMEEHEPYEVRDHFAMALAGMLQAAQTEQDRHSYDEQSMLETASIVLQKFRKAIPSPMVTAMGAIQPDKQ